MVVDEETERVTFEEFYHDIGRMALDAAQDISGKLLLYSEVEEEVVSADIFYLNSARVVQYKYSSRSLKASIYSFWEQWTAESGNSKWFAMTYVIDGGKFSIDLEYPDQVNLDEDVGDRRLLAVRKHFDDLMIDYSSPDTVCAPR